MKWVVTLVVLICLLSGCGYSRHYGRVGEDRRPLALIDEYRVPRIEFGKSTPEELRGVLRPTVMTVWFQPRRTQMGDVAGGYPLRVQVQPDGFADERPSFSYGSAEVPKTALTSMKPKQTSSKSTVPLIRKLGEVRPEDFKLPYKSGEADLGSVVPEHFQQPRPKEKSYQKPTSDRPTPASQAKPHEKAADIKALALEALKKGVNAAPAGNATQITPPCPTVPTLPSGLDPKLEALEHLQHIF